MKVIIRHMIILGIVVLGWTTRQSYAQTFPDPLWTEYSVSDGSVHSYTVTGDNYLVVPSSFVWVVKGGTLYTDAAGTTIAGDGITAQMLGIAGNTSTLYVKWDKDGPGQGWVYAYEVSGDGCQQPLTMQKAYSGVRVNKIGKATVHFLADQSDYCSDDGPMVLDLELSGLPPFTLLYSIEGEDQLPLNVLKTELQDLDEDGQEDDYALDISGWAGIVEEKNVVFMIKKISSDGVEGMVEDPSTHTVHIHPLPIIEDFNY